MQGKGSSHSFERGASVRISGRRGNRPTDPVEEYRANYHTEALEVHPPVPINGFINKLLVMRTNDNQLFLEEFGSIEMAPQQPCSVAELPSNRNKNRYHNILPYDHSRVKLSHSKNQTDYINTSYCSVREGLMSLVEVMIVLIIAGVHEGPGVRSNTGPPARYRSRLLEDGLGTELTHHRHAHQHPGI